MDEYYCLPKELFTTEYATYSIQAKLLFSIVITEANTVKSILDLSSLISDMGSRELSEIYHNIHNKISESEGA